MLAIEILPGGGSYLSIYLIMECRVRILINGDEKRKEREGELSRAVDSSMVL